MPDTPIIGLITALTGPAFTAFGAPTSWAELLGFATGLVTARLVVRQHIANRPLGIANVLMLVPAGGAARTAGDVAG